MHNFYEFDIDRYGNFNKPENVGDGVAGHEVLQNAWLKLHGYSTNRGTGAASRDNPSIGLGKAIHDSVSNQQRALGLFNATILRTQTAIENIRMNVQAMRNTSLIPENKILTVANLAINHGVSLSAIPAGTIL